VVSEERPLFIVNTVVGDADAFRALAEQASRLKQYGRVEMVVSALSAKARYEFPPGGNAWHEYASNNPALHKFFPHEKIAPFIPADYVAANLRGLDARLEILRELGLGACFWAGEPAFLPEAFFATYPHLRGPRVDHPRRSRHEEFAPCVDHEENIEMFSSMMAELAARVPELGTFMFKTNDAGSGICWADWLYSGPNGPAACRRRTTGQRVASFMRALRDGAKRAGSDVQIRMVPQFRPGETTEIALLLPEGCHAGGRDDNTVHVDCSMLNACYPVKGVLDPLDVIRASSRIDLTTAPTVVLSGRVYYNRDIDRTEVWRRDIDIIERSIRQPVEGLLPTLTRLAEHCADWVGDERAEPMMEALDELADLLDFQFAALSPLSTIYFGVSLRHVTRPLVVAPEYLSQEEEDYWLPHVFNIWVDQARADYTDFHGGVPRQVTLDAVGGFLRRLARTIDSIDRIAHEGGDEFFVKMALALRIHVSIIRSVANFFAMQQIRDRNAEKLSQPRRPSKLGDWSGDNDLQAANTLMRDELDNAGELVRLLEDGGMEMIAHATREEDEDTFLLGGDLVAQVKRKMEIMRRHWIDAENHLASPLK
jgi:hypothetical protein